MHRFPARRTLLYVLIVVGLMVPIALVPIATAPAGHHRVLDLETLTGLEAERMMDAGELTSVELTEAYIARIDALNKRGPGLNAVTQLNPNALEEAKASDQRRKHGHLLGPADGLPLLMKDLIDVKGMYTSNGNYSLRHSFPAEDSGVAEKLHARGVVILGKLGLSEYANFFGGQHSGFANLTGQVINGLDADQGPSGSSSGSGAAGAAALSMLTIGTETSGSIIGPSGANGIVGLRPTVGLVPGVGIGPISASQDTAGPMDRTVENAALTLSSIAGADPESSYAGLWGLTPAQDALVIPPLPAVLPDYMSALDLNFVRGKRIGYNGTLTPGTPLALAYDALVAAGAILVPRSTTLSPALAPFPTGNILNSEARRDINRYYAHLGPDAPIKSLDEEIAVNNAEAQQALKFGNATHASVNSIIITDTVGGVTTSDPTNAAANTYKNALLQGKIIAHEGIDRMLSNDNADPSDDFIAILGSVPNGPRAGYPQLTIPMGYSATQRRAVNISVNGTAYSERDLLGIAYVIEQGTKLRQPASMVNPSMYRCAATIPAPPFADRGGCNPAYDELIKMAGKKKAPILPFSLETESVTSLQARMAAGTLSAETLTEAYLARIALVNADGPALQAVRSINEDALKEAKELDKERKKKGPRGPLHGIPVLLDDSIDVEGLPTTGGSIALQEHKPKDDSVIVAKLKAAGAIILGKTNVSELNGMFDANMPEGYSSLAGQVLLPPDTDNNVGGSSGGSAAATTSGLAALTVGMETATADAAQLIAPAGVAGVVGLKPTVGRVSRDGVMPVAKSQDSPGALTRTVWDAALWLQATAGVDPADPGTTGAPAVPNYLAGLVPTALAGKRVAVISSTTVPYPTVVSTITSLGATTVVKTVGTPSPNPASIVASEFKRDLNAYLGEPGAKGSKGAKSLQEIIDYNGANPIEGLKYQQGQLLAAQAVDLSDPATAAAYESDKATGKASNKAVIDAILNNGTPVDLSDDFDVVVVPSGNGLVGIADRAGYPVLSVPAAYGTPAAGRNPIGVTFVGGAFSEAKLLAAGFAYEQATSVRQAPSFTNPSMFRCVPGSTFFTAELCHPGDRQLD